MNCSWPPPVTSWPLRNELSHYSLSYLGKLVLVGRIELPRLSTINSESIAATVTPHQHWSPRVDLNHHCSWPRTKCHNQIRRLRETRWNCLIRLIRAEFLFCCYHLKSNALLNLWARYFTKRPVREGRIIASGSASIEVLKKPFILKLQHAAPKIPYTDRLSQNLGWIQSTNNQWHAPILYQQFSPVKFQSQVLLHEPYAQPLYPHIWTLAWGLPKYMS